ncbi:MAG: glycoside hydrolase family 3 protein [Alphaproteobacteria bacterium]|nr:glycoside hydrolase family 3 protein [Alphaproteobacteria bacterium]
MTEILPVFLSCQGPRLSDDEKRLFAEYNPLGVCLFSRFCENIKDTSQVKALIKDIKEAVGRDNVLISVDQEGGRVRRLLEPEFTAVTAQQNIVTDEQAREHAYLISADLKSCGINVNFAPVLDTLYPETSTALQGRCFTCNIAELGASMVNEYIKNGICPCIKHMPGHGRAAVDPHLNLPVIEASLDELQQDFAPFKALNDAPMGMLAHIVLTAVDKDNAATVSAKVIKEIIRGDIAFKGLLVSDAIVMKALKGSIAEKAKRSIAAGCDVICLGNTDFAANVELCKSGIRMHDETAERLQKIFDVINKSADFGNYEYVKNKYCENLKNIISYDYQYDATEVLNQLRQSNKGD